MNSALIDRLKEFLEQEARSCSMDFGCVTPLYAYRMWVVNTHCKTLKLASGR